jgi:hypothetical protein
MIIEFALEIKNIKNVFYFIFILKEHKLEIYKKSKNRTKI